MSDAEEIHSENSISRQQLHQLFLSYRKGRELVDGWQETLGESMSRDTWLSKTQHHCQDLNLQYCETSLLIEQVLQPLSDHPELISDDLYDALFDEIMDMYLQDYDDPFTLRQVELLLIPHYKGKKDLERLILCYQCAGYACQEISRLKEHSIGLKSVHYFKKILLHKDKFMQFQNPACRVSIFIAYSNLLRVANTLGNMSTPQVYALWLDYQEFCGTPQSHAFDEEQPRIPALRAFIEEDVQTYLYSAYCEEHMKLNGSWRSSYDASTGELLCGLCKSYMEKVINTAEKLSDIPCELLFNYQDLLASTKVISWNEAWIKLNDYYHQFFTDISNIEFPEEDDIAVIVNPLHRIITAINRSSLPVNQKSELCVSYCNSIIDYINCNLHTAHSYALNNALEGLCFDPALLHCIKQNSIKKNLIFHFVISRHASTFMHSQMVRKAVSLILDSVFEHCPQLLVGLRKTKSVSEILSRQKEIKSFASQAALFHDIGKNSLIDIINTEQRKISDLEFNIIKKHPQMGALYLSKCAAFRPYRDIAHGHHKFYNGKGGYPADFDNLASPDKPLIDLVTICDCLDAATDYLGRNYNRAKNLEQVLEEFRADSGTRYHPGYVTLLLNDRELQDALRHLITEERKEIYYNIYKNYFV